MSLHDKYKDIADSYSVNTSLSVVFHCHLAVTVVDLVVGCASVAFHHNRGVAVVDLVVGCTCVVFHHHRCVAAVDNKLIW